MLNSSTDPTPEPPAWTATRVRELRYNLALSQAEFAAHLNVSRQAFKAWEQGQKRPGGPAARLLDLAHVHPEWLTGAGTRSARVGDHASGHQALRDHASGGNAQTNHARYDHVRDDRVHPDTPTPASAPIEHARTLARVREREYPDWWREHAITAFSAFLQNAIYYCGRRFFVLPAPCADAPESLAEVRKALGPGPFPDLMVVPQAAATVGRWSAITSVRLTVDILPTSRAANGTARSLVRWPQIEVMERWTVDPFAHRLTVWRIDAPTRHHTARLEWRLEPTARPTWIAIKRFFLSFAQFPIDWAAIYPANIPPAAPE